MNFTRRQTLVGASLAVTAVAAGTYGLFASPDYKAPVYANDGIAIDGTDAVAYFTENKPVAGSSENAFEWNGATWHFASVENMESFKANPAKFAPAYGGYCAWAIAEKKQLASTQPSNWAVVDNRLFLNFNDSVQERWNADIARFIKMGDENWPDIVKEFEAA